jgi:putative Mg2+ transporter-C (MgtC) family protein
MFDLTFEIELLIRLLLAAVLGMAIGAEREYVGKPAGMRTYALVALGATLFTIISQYGFSQGEGTIDTTRIAAQIVTGIGFLGAGVIILQRGHVTGLTTASGLWVAAAIGMAVGVGMYIVAIVSTIIALVLTGGFRKFDIENWKRGQRK